MVAAWAKSYQDPISINKLGVVAYTCDPSYNEAVGRRTAV
jgi:hypothetical protein